MKMIFLSDQPRISLTDNGHFLFSVCKIMATSSLHIKFVTLTLVSVTFM